VTAETIVPQPGNSMPDYLDYQQNEATL